MMQIHNTHHDSCDKTCYDTSLIMTPAMIIGIATHDVLWQLSPWHFMTHHDTYLWQLHNSLLLLLSKLSPWHFMTNLVTGDTLLWQNYTTPTMTSSLTPCYDVDRVKAVVSSVLGRQHCTELLSMVFCQHLTNTTVLLSDGRQQRRLVTKTKCCNDYTNSSNTWQR